MSYSHKRLLLTHLDDDITSRSGLSSQGDGTAIELPDTRHGAAESPASHLNRFCGVFGPDRARLAASIGTLIVSAPPPQTKVAS